ncbi:MAG: protein kinase [Pirellulaceae bacterium]|nr:protein kinase [Planctomycetales bacterium]
MSRKPQSEAPQQPRESQPTESQPTVSADDSVVVRFLRAARNRPELRIEQFTEPLPTHDETTNLIALVAAELTLRMERGESVRVEEYLQRFPQLGPRDKLPSLLIAKEIESRQRRGERVTQTEYVQRFPKQMAELLAPPSRSKDTTPTRPTSQRPLFAPGSRVGDFQILEVLGRGGSADVYAAQQLSLDRKVVIKLSRDTVGEARILAQLDHPHIVQIYSQHEHGPYNVIVMRYVPGATLTEWLLNLPPDKSHAWSGTDLAKWLNQRIGHDGDPHDLRRAGIPYATQADDLQSASLSRAVAMIMLDIAQALSHAHRRGVLHLDIKPSNILLDSRGRALLMDFHISSLRQDATDMSHHLQGGTLAYMSPEQLFHFLGHSDDRLARLDERSDVFALGLVFHELLFGQPAWPLPAAQLPTDAAQRLLAARKTSPMIGRSVGPHISQGLRSILARCLAPDPDQRYANCELLTQDLTCWLNDKPLRHAADPSLKERSGKWLRRNRLRLGIVAGACLLLSTFLGWQTSREFHRLQVAEHFLAEANTNIIDGQYPSAMELLHQARAELHVPPSWPGAWLTESRRHHANDTVRELTDRLAPFQWQPNQQHSDMQAISLSGIRADLGINPLTIYSLNVGDQWREQFQVDEKNPADRRSFLETVTEVLLVQLTIASSVAKDNSADHQAAVSHFFRRLPGEHQHLPLIEFLQTELASKSIAQIELASLANAANDEFQHYLVGVVAGIRGDNVVATEQFELCLRENPQRYWAHFFAAFCYHRAGRSEQAIRSYGACQALQPDYVWSYYHLGLLYHSRNNFDEALEQLLIAEEKAPEQQLIHAALAETWSKKNEWQKAIASFTRAIELGNDTAAVYTGRGVAHFRSNNLRAALFDVRRALSQDPASPNARRLMRILQMRRANDVAN